MAELKKYVCGPCGYEYDPEIGDPDNGVAPGTPFEELPEDWVCPICGLGKDVFEEAQDVWVGKGDILIKLKSASSEYP